MSDPAFASTFEASDFTPIDKVPRDAASVYIFDFDGVVASGTEDQIYRRDEADGERLHLERLEDRFNLRSRDMDFRYRRHLLFQELALELDLSIAKGPGFELAKWASDHARLFILTARSGWAATSRLRAFLSQTQLKPIDLYQVGRVHKDRQIAKLVEELSPARVYYIEDSLAHLSHATDLKLDMLTPVHCSETIRPDDVDTLYAKVFGTLEAAYDRGATEQS